MAESSNNDQLSPTGDGGPSLEELQEQLAEMEAAQTVLADQLQTQTDEPQLDHRLAVIEEQFRQSFDDRLRAGSATGSATTITTSGRSAASRSMDQSADVLLINRVLRDVSRLMADDWRPVFDGLTAAFPTDVVSSEMEALERQPTLIQGYRALLTWKELCGEQFDIRQLVDVLRKCKMEDIADAAIDLIEKRDINDNKTKSTKPVQRRKSDVTSRLKPSVLDNRRILLLSKKIGGDWEALGRALNVPDEELNDIKEGPDGATYHGAFKMLWAWRQQQPSGEEEASTDILRRALQQVNKEQLVEQLTAN